jgi:dienelactone hydrolase
MRRYPGVVFWFVASFIMAGITTPGVAEQVTFLGTTTTKEGNRVHLSGKLTKPAGSGLFPAVVLLHGCGGIERHDDEWAETLAKWGYVALQVDSLSPRTESNICMNPFLVSFAVRVADAYDGQHYLAGLPYVIPTRIAVMGWSHGGITTLAAVSPRNYALSAGLFGGHLPRKPAAAFNAAIAFYPYCTGPLTDTEVPLLILIGELDDWTPAALCEINAPSKRGHNEVILNVYPGAYHAFDWEGLNMTYQGHRLEYNAAATADAKNQVKAFLDKYLK